MGIQAFFDYGYAAGLGARDYSYYDSSTTLTAVNPYITFMLFDPNLDVICEITISTTSNRPDTTVFGASTAAAGFIFDTSASTVTTDCDGLLDPSVWGSNIATTVRLGGMTYGVGLNGPLTSADPLYTNMSVALPTLGVDWTTDFEPYLVGVGVYLSALNGFLAADLDNDGVADTTHYARSWAVDSSFVATGLLTGKNNALTTDGGIMGGSIYVITFPSTVASLFF
jgi:hypothetical protein